MKAEIHPNYHKIKIVMTDGTEYDTYSTWGKEGDVMKLDIDPRTHPAWTGGERRIMEKGQLSKFEKRFSGFSAAGGKPQETPAEEPKEAKAAKGK